MESISLDLCSCFAIASICLALIARREVYQGTSLEYDSPAFASEAL